jgi:superfamily II DNA helicase RecQ
VIPSGIPSYLNLNINTSLHDTTTTSTTMSFLATTTTSPKMAFEETAEYAEKLCDINQACLAKVGHIARHWQARAALALQHRHNVLLISATGSGKSLAYQALTFLRDGIVLVIMPLNQLMDQQVSSLEAIGIPSVALTAEQQEPGLFKKILEGHYKIVFVSPERTLAREGALWELITSKDQAFLNKLLYVVVDEAHLVFDWGQSFRPAYANIPALRPYLRKCNIPMIAMTATANSAKIERLLKTLEFDAGQSIMLHETTNRPNIYYAVTPITKGEASSFVRSLILRCYNMLTFIIEGSALACRTPG